MENKRTSPRIDWIVTGPLAPHVAAYLTDRGYAGPTFSNCTRCIAHFAH